MIYRFQAFELDDERFELRRNGEPVAVQARVLRALLYLIEQRARVVSKNELIEAVWADTVVSDTGLSQVIMLARRALSDEGEQQLLLKTVRGRGFRFVAAVETASQPERTALRPTLVGRGCELQGLLGWLADATQGRGSLGLLGGEPGIGKSSLVEALAAEAQVQGVEVLWGKAWEEGGAPPYWPFTQVLRGLVERHGESALRERGGDELTRLWTDGADAGAESDARAPDGERGRNRFRLFDAMARVLCGTFGHGKASRSAGCGQPRLIILEDLHACDDESLLMLRFVSRELARSSLLIVGTYRDLELSQRAQLRLMLESAPATRQLLLRGLSQADCGALLSQRLVEPPPPRMAAAMFALSAGNPLFMAELGRQYELGTLPQFVVHTPLAQIAVPERIGAAVRSHIEALPDATREALTGAATLGRVFSPPLLAELLEISEHELLEQLAPAFARGILSPSSNPNEAMFAHALVRNSVYSKLSSHRRAELHQRIGVLLERRTRTIAPPLFELANHYYLGVAVGGRGKAIEFVRRAAAHALELQAYETAAELSDRAVDLMRLEGVSADELLVQLFAAGQGWYLAGQLERAVAHFDSAAALARDRQNRPQFAVAVASACFALRGTILYDRERMQQIASALRGLPDTDSSIRAMLLPVSVLDQRSPDRLAERRATTRAGIEMARRLGHPTAVAQALSCSHLALWGAAPPRELFEMARELLQLSRDLDDDELLLDALIWTMIDSVELGDGQSLARASEEYAARVASHNGGWHLYIAALTESMHYSCIGNSKLAEEASVRALNLGQRQREPLAESFFAVRQLFRWLEDAALQMQAPAPEMPRSLPSSYQVFWILALIRSQRVERARSILGRLGAEGFSDLPVDALRRPSLACLAQAAVELGELELAEQAHALLERDADLHVLLQAGVYLGPVALYLARVEAALGRPRVAAERYEDALTRCRLLGAAGQQLRIHLEYADLLSASSSERSQRSLLPPSAAGTKRLKELLEGALSLAQELDAGHWLQQARRLMDQHRRMFTAV